MLNELRYSWFPAKIILVMRTFYLNKVELWYKDRGILFLLFFKKLRIYLIFLSAVRL